jgi:5-methylcytosine-specific restriction protein A
MPKAPRRCPGANGTCGYLITTTKYCPEHTAEHSWTNKKTATQSSISHQQADWRRLRRQVLASRPDCALQLTDRCTGRATEVDLIVPAAQGGEIRSANAQPVCHPCHAIKTRRERDQW